MLLPKLIVRSNSARHHGRFSPHDHEVIVLLVLPLLALLLLLVLHS